MLVELVDSGRVGVVVLLVGFCVVAVVDEDFGRVDDVVANVVDVAPTTTLPRIDGEWILQ
jgi:hypothetical protein